MDGEPVGLLIANIHDRGVLGALGIFSKWIVTSEEEYLGSLSPPSGLPPTSSLLFSKMATLRERQITALSSLLSLNSPSSSSSSSSLTPSSSNQLPTWKVLVMDKIAQDVLATSLRVQDLRDSGVTLHMFVSSSLSLIHPTWSISLPANLTH